MGLYGISTFSIHIYTSLCSAAQKSFSATPLTSAFFVKEKQEQAVEMSELEQQGKVNSNLGEKKRGVDSDLVVEDTAFEMKSLPFSGRA